MPNTAADSDQENSPVHVAVGIVLDPQGKILITQRPAASHQGGKWEFPGGKRQPHEEILHALARELNEELGIHVQTAHPFLRIHHAYVDKTVLLDVWKVTAYQGEVHGREGQPLRWVSYNELGNYDFPAADLPILDALLLPNLYVISDAHRLGATTFLAKLERALRAGVRLVQVREKHLMPEAYLDFAGRVIHLAHAHSAKVLLNAEPGMVAQTGADGVHLTSERLLATHSRPLARGLLVAASCHSAQELAWAEHIQADFAVLSPVLDTSSHVGAVTLGWARFGGLVQAAHLPIYALGGMRAHDLGSALATGAQGLAMISGIWESQTPEAVVAGFTGPTSK